MLEQKKTRQVFPKSKEEWLSYVGSCHPLSIDLGIERVKCVAARLDLLRFSCPVIMVAGTNGKGSCVELMKAILMAAGLRVATYMSPHLLHYNERIRIDNETVSDTELCDAFESIERVRDDITLTFFEFGTLAALWLFKRSQLDAIILEVGLGGRLDAVNCIDADVAVISTVDLDHMDWLGHTRECIAREKAGIMRTNKPCVFGDCSLPQSIDEQAALLGSPLYIQGQAFTYRKDHCVWSWQSQQQTLSNLPLPRIKLQNAATALQAIELLSGHFCISRTAIEEGLRQVYLPGRFQVIERNGIRVILDVAHNPAGGRYLARRFATEPKIGRVYAIVGMLADKDIKNTVAPLTDLIDDWYLADLCCPRGAAASQLRQYLLEIVPESCVTTFSSPIIAYQQACHTAKKGDSLLVFGSFHTVAEVLNAV